MEKPLISVIVPVYNVEKYIDDCVNSIVEQHYKNLEIILVDDGSTDSSGKKCDYWMTADRRITVIHQENGGLSDARNTGLSYANGEYIGFVDSDDIIHPAMYEKLYTAMQETKSEIAGCEIFCDEAPDIEALERHSKPGKKEYTSEEALRKIIDNADVYVTVWNKLYPKNLIEDIRFERGKIHEDEYWSYQIIAKAEKIVMLSSCYYGYRRRNNSIMAQKYSLKNLDLLEARERRLKFIKEKFPALFSLDCCRLRFECVRACQLSLKYLDKDDREKRKKIMKGIVQKNPLTYREYKNLPIGKKVWCFLSNISFTGTCYLRNWLHFGP